MRVLVNLILSTILVIALFCPASAKVQKLTLGPGEEPEISVRAADGGTLSLEFTLPALDLEEIVVENEKFQALTIPGGAVRGAAGQAGLPSFSRLVAVPEGAVLRAEIREFDTGRLEGYRLFPVQPDEANEFVIDRAYYQGLSAPEDISPVTLGEPAIMAGLRVVPVHFHPVSYDPVSGELSVAKRMEVELSFGGSQDRAAPREQRPIPASFDRLFNDVVLNYSRDESTPVGLGTYLIIYRNNSSILTRIQPLIDWRRRQGYNVVVAHTGQTGTTENSIKSYIQSLYDSADPPLEFVCLVGDATGTYEIPTWRETLSGEYGEGDHYYTELEGGDILADVHIGRLSFDDYTTLEDIVDKILTYETNPPTSDAGWFTRAGLAGDGGSWSGMTCKFVNQWLKQHLLAHGYTEVDTLWSPSAGLMSACVNQGLSVFGFRGYYNVAGWTVSYIDNLNNGMELPFAIIITCDTGSFERDGNCRSEAMLRNPHGGGIGAIGTATIGTATRYNNAYYQGAWHGVVNMEDHRLGMAPTRGKLELYINYYGWNSSQAEYFAVWNNLMGDPATPLWTAYPSSITVSHPSELAVGANSVPVQVTESGSPVEGAMVALYKDGEIRSTGQTDFYGEVNLPISDYNAGDLLVTVTMHNFIPYQGELTLGTMPKFLAYEDSNVDDDNSGGSSGNDNSTVNPGETIELPVALHNHGNTTATGVTASLSINDINAQITDDTETFGNIGGNSTVWSGEDFDFSVSPSAPDGHVLAFDLEAQSGLDTWTSLIELTVQSAAFDQEGYTWGGDGSTLDPGESGTLLVGLRNNGSIMGTAVTAILESSSPWITITDADGYYGNIAVGSWAENSSNSFALSVYSDCFEGHLAAFTLTATFGDGYVDEVEFTLPVGTTSTNDPMGPDAYGYYAFDNTDTNYPWAPAYNWVEIASNYGGPGTSAGLTDFGYEDDDTRTLTLPFVFNYYGEPYANISNLIHYN